VNDEASWWSPAEPDEAAIVALLESRGVEFTTLDGWHKLDEHELALGAAAERTRIKVVPRDDMVAISNA
jgi:ferredoxin--NADP+ reductase